MSLNEYIVAARHIAVLQADNPDGDSLGCSLAMEAIFSEMGKKVSLACGVDIPQHLRYLEGWSRVQKEIPKDCDLVLLVDANSESLLLSLQKSGELSWLKTKTVIVLDHHTESDGLSFATQTIVRPTVSVGELIYDLAKEYDWNLPLDAMNMLAVSIMSDSLGLTSEGTTSHSIRVIADLVDSGVSLAELEQSRRDLMRKERELLPYKGELLERVEYDISGRIAVVAIPQKEIDQFSPLYNPSMLVIDEMRMVVGVDVAIVFKEYSDGRVTAKIRCNHGKGIAADLARYFGGGGHPYASGFKISDGRDFNSIKVACIDAANRLLDQLTTE
jgi:phosphoesterase RecJ-like protein